MAPSSSAVLYPRPAWITAVRRPIAGCDGRTLPASPVLLTASLLEGNPAMTATATSTTTRRRALPTHDHFTDEQRRQAAELIADTRRAGGLAPVDLERFWADDAEARRDHFVLRTQLPLGFRMNRESVFDELGVPEDALRFENDRSWAAELVRAYNDRAERIVGRRQLNEGQPPVPELVWPERKHLHDLFEGRNVWHGGSWWLEADIAGPDELAALLDRVEARLGNLRAFILPPSWDEAKPRLLAAGIKPSLFRWQRGPVTFATSIYGVEKLIYLIEDQPDLAQRFSDLIARGILAIARLIDTEAGYTPATAPHGFGFADDNCAMLNAEGYRLFGWPVLRAVFDAYCSDPKDRRYQHSDSAMAHLLPLFGRLGMTGVNFGPNLTIPEIRAHLPRAIIDGQLAPFTFSRNQEERIVLETLRDAAYARAGGGVNFCTAGSINNGSRLSGMRLIMAAIQRYGRFD